MRNRPLLQFFVFLAVASAIVGLLVARFSGMGLALLAAAVTFAFLFALFYGLGAALTAQHERAQKRKLPPELRPVMGQMLSTIAITQEGIDRGREVADDEMLREWHASSFALTEEMVLRIAEWPERNRQPAYQYMEAVAEENVHKAVIALRGVTPPQCAELQQYAQRSAQLLKRLR